MAERLGVDHQRLQQFMTSSTWPVKDVRARLAWRAVAAVRPEVWAVDDTGYLAQTGRGVHRLLSLDTRPLSAGGGSMEAIAPWLAAFEAAGQGIAHAAQSGNLQRGPRRVLTHHVIFHWNRHGLPAHTQAVLAHAARAVILAPTATT
ncbi:transposase [Streptomyces sp. NPDC059957]|uniref:transposase n=1 Tax=Streptomyces sp. NPDC059957 TaxID=3347016 RepID=UPI003669D9FB